MISIKSIHKSKHTKRIIYSVADQMILSGVNFFLSYLLLKILSKEEYGLYNLIIPVSLIFTAIQNALINTPFMVEYWSKEENERENFISSLILIQKKFLGILLLIILVISLSISLIFNSSSLLVLFASFSILVFGLLSREFIRNYFFTIEKPEKAVINDGTYLFIITILLTILYLRDSINIGSVLIIIGLASILSSVFRIKQLLIHRDLSLALKHFSECFRHGRWALLGAMVTHIQSYGYLYLIGFFFSTKDIGDLAAIRLLFIPFAFITIGYGKIAIPRGSKLIIEGNLRKFLNEELFFSFSYSLIVLIYSIVINFLPKDLLVLVLKKEYMTALEYIPFFSISTIFSILGATGSNGLQSLKKFKSLSQINTISMIIVLIITLIGINFIGIYGALIANILGQLVNASGMWYLCFKAKNNHKEIEI